MRGRFEGGLADGAGAVVRNPVGDGSVVYVGTWPDDELAGALVEALLDGAGVETSDPMPDGVRLTRRDGLTWVTNFRREPVTVDVQADVTWLFGDGALDGVDAAVTDAEPSDVSIVTE